MLKRFPDAVWFEASARLELSGYVLPNQGEMNNVAIGFREDRPVAVIKAPKHNPYADTTQMLQREIACVQTIGAVGADLIIATPTVQDHQLDAPSPWAAFGYAAGDVLGNEGVDALPHEALVAHGKQIGEFVATLATAINPDVFAATVDKPHGPCGIDRIALFSERYRKAPEMLRANGYPNLARAVQALGQDYEALNGQNLLTPRIVGHDDLQPGNYAFAKVDGSHTLSAIFDLALTKLSTPEREFRFLANHHEAVLVAATQAYEDATDDHVSEKAVCFWHRVQHLVSCILIVESGKRPSPKFVPYLQRTLPDVDWASELTAE